MPQITTQVFDAVQGQPADGMHIEVFRLEENDAVHPVRETVTGPDGRPSRPLIHGDEMERGEYELRFLVGDYFRAASVVEPEPRFLTVVSVRFAVADPEDDYHLPLIVSPWSYTVHRG